MRRLLAPTILITVLTGSVFAQAPRIPDKFTNLQVLPKDITKQDLIATMKIFTRPLGVRCMHCHDVNDQITEGDLATDNKPEKAVARTMIKMTAELNDKYVSQVKLPDNPAPKTVNCWTCHRGQAKPESGPPPPAPKTAEAPKP
jgi:hypothetical protein